LAEAGGEEEEKNKRDSSPAEAGIRMTEKSRFLALLGMTTWVFGAVSLRTYLSGSEAGVESCGLELNVEGKSVVGEFFGRGRGLSTVVAR